MRTVRKREGISWLPFNGSKRSLDIRPDDVSCLYKLALLRGTMGDGPAYHETLEDLREVEPAAAHHVEWMIKQSGVELRTDTDGSESETVEPHPQTIAPQGEVFIPKGTAPGGEVFIPEGR